MSIKSKLLPFLPYGLVMKYHYRKVDPSSIEDVIGQGLKYDADFDMNRKIISVQGRGYSGSGAFVDLMREYECNMVLGAYELENTPEKTQKEITKSPSLEFDILRHSGGIMELGYLLPIGNIYVNDAAIHRFIDFIDNWLKGLNGKTPISSPEFRKIVASFLDALILQRIPMGSQTAFNPHLYKEAKTNNYIYITKDLSQEQYQEIARGFIFRMFSLFDSNGNIVLDQFLADRVYDTNLFDKYIPNYKIVQVIRDPRDVYATAVNYSVSWIPKSSSSEFIIWYSHALNKLKSDNRLKVFRFENLVYDYDHTVSEIEKFVGLQSIHHTRKFDFFDPKISKKNIGLYKHLSSEYASILHDIENELEEFCYNR